jgi:hypothetical protein
MLEDTISLHEMCDSLKKSSCTIEHVHTPLLMSQVLDYGDFLFLKKGGCALHLDIKCRTLRKVYETKDNYLGDIRPFMMIWPPRFPALKNDPKRFVFVLQMISMFLLRLLCFAMYVAHHNISIP